MNEAAFAKIEQVSERKGLSSSMLTSLTA